MNSGARVWGRSGGAGPLIVGHRGASAHEPENSLRAFERAARDGADGVELDVLCCATGEVVVFHDDDLIRLGGGKDRIADLPLAAVRAVTLRGEVAIPTLEEALEACGSMLVNVELKSSGPGDRTLSVLIDGVSSALDRTGKAAQVLVSSFSHRALWRWRWRRPDVPAGLLFESGAPLPLRRGWALPVIRPLAVHPEAALCTAEGIRRWHQRGYLVNTWTVDDPERLRTLRDHEIDAVICNDPAAARAALKLSTRRT